MRRKNLLIALVVACCALSASTGALAAHLTVAAPGHLSAQRLAVVAPKVCWNGSVTFTPTASDNGNPPSFHKLNVAGSGNAFSGCIGQYADVSINKGGAQVDYAKSYKLSSNDLNGFTVNLAKSVLPMPVPAGTTYTLVIHP